MVNDGTVMPFLSANSDAMMDATENRYATIVANGGWPKVPSGKFKKGSQGAAIKALNRRLFLEGYLRPEGVEGDRFEIDLGSFEDGRPAPSSCSSG